MRDSLYASYRTFRENKVNKEIEKIQDSKDRKQFKILLCRLLKVPKSEIDNLIRSEMRKKNVRNKSNPT